MNPDLQDAYHAQLHLLEQARARLYRKCDTSLLDTVNFQMPKTISAFEGGCLFPAHPSLAVAANNVLLDTSAYPSQVYPQNNVLDELVLKIRGHFHKNHSIPLDIARNVTFGMGVSHLLDAFVSSVCSPGKIILAPESYYHAFVSWPEKWNVSHIKVGTDKKNSYKLLAADLDRWFEENAPLSPDVGALLLTNPTTTGEIYTRTELQELAEVISRRGIFTFVDEIYRDTEYGQNRTVSLASLNGMADYCVTCASGSKNRSAANFRFGWGCGPDAIIRKMNKYFDVSITDFSWMMQRMGCAILNTPQAYIEAARAEHALRAKLLKNGFQLLNENLKHHFGIDYDIVEIPVHPEAGFCLLLRMEGLRNAELPNGDKIKNSLDLAEYLAFPANYGTDLKGVCLSVGSTRGHDDIICYFAFAQSGHEFLSAAAAPHVSNYVQNHVFGDKSTVFNPDYAEALQHGRLINNEAVHRIEAAIRKIKLPIS